MTRRSYAGIPHPLWFCLHYTPKIKNLPYTKEHNVYCSWVQQTWSGFGNCLFTPWHWSTQIEDKPRRGYSYPFDPFLKGQAVTQSFCQVFNSFIGDNGKVEEITFQSNNGWIKYPLFRRQSIINLRRVLGERVLPWFLSLKNLFYFGNGCLWKCDLLFIKICLVLFLLFSSDPGFCQSRNISRT